jgi:tRNA(Ile)-lysidine synthase
LVAFSGGPDSTALLAGLAAVCPAPDAARLVAGHFNHGLRGAESDDDAAFAVEFAARLGIECVVGRGDVVAVASRQGDGVEAAARDQRYAFLTATAARLGLRQIVTAHTLDDQAETVLHRLLRGTGPAGLAGIPRARALADGAIGLIRPLLGFRRAEVLDYLRERGLPFRVDSSNVDLRYTRNRLRHELLPQLARDYNPQVVEALARLAGQVDEWRGLIGDLAAPLVERAIVRIDAAGGELDCRALRAIAQPLVREVLVAVWRRCRFPLQAMGFAEWEALATMTLGGGPAKRMFPGNIVVERVDERLTLRCTSDAAQGTTVDDSE